MFTDKELEIMRVIWDLGEATVKDIPDRLTGDQRYNSVLTIIRVLERKCHLKHRADGRTHVYSAVESREKARRYVLSHLVSQVFGGSAASVVLNLVESGELTRKDLDEIRQRISLKNNEA